MDNQHRLVKGYRDLSQTEIDAMNSIKLAEQDIGQLFQQVRGLDGVDQRVMAITKTKLQEAFSWFVRAVAKPLDVYELHIEPAKPLNVLERAELEEQELSVKIKGLRDYIEKNPHFLTLADNMQRMLKGQLEGMETYHYNLFFRLNEMRNNPPEGGWQ